MQLVRGIYYYPSFFKIMTHKTINLFLKRPDFKKNAMYLINGVHRFCTCYAISLLYKLWTQFVIGISQHPLFLKMTFSKMLFI